MKSPMIASRRFGRFLTLAFDSSASNCYDRAARNRRRLVAKVSARLAIDFLRSMNRKSAAN
jgi:hypothetical protein